jgi:sugar diacid utilization regulator
MLLLQQGVRPRERELVDQLLGADDAVMRAQAGKILESEGYLQSGRAIVFVVEPPAGGTSSDDEVLLSQIVVAVKRILHPGAVAATTQATRCVLVVSLEGRGEPSAEAAEMALRVHGCLTTLPKEQVGGRSSLVTYGNAFDAWAEAGVALRQAAVSAHVARRVTGLGSVVGWVQLGVYQVLGRLPEDALGNSDADRRLTALLEKPDLVLTLETYLEFAGDAKRTAEELNLHRASLYYRLSRIEELLDIDLKRGEDRLTMHVALKSLHLR